MERIWRQRGYILYDGQAGSRQERSGFLLNFPKTDRHLAFDTTKKAELNIAVLSRKS